MQNRVIKLVLLFAIAALISACGRISFSTENTNPLAKPTEELTQLQREIRDMQTADFKFIYVFKRQDGGEFDKADRDFLRTNRTPDINRWSATEDKKAYLAGSNYPFLPEHWENLKKQFVIEDYSKPLEVINVETNTNK